MVQITKEDIARHIACIANLQQEDARNVVTEVFDYIKRSVRSGYAVSIRTYGTIKPKHKPARHARNLQANEPMTVPAKWVASFTVSRQFNDEVDAALRNRTAEELR